MFLHTERCFFLLCLFSTGARDQKKNKDKDTKIFNVRFQGSPPEQKSFGSLTEN
jgi:hypothetical protein